MNADLFADFRPVLDRLQALAAADPAFHRQLVRALSHALFVLSQDPGSAAAVGDPPALAATAGPGEPPAVPEPAAEAAPRAEPPESPAATPAPEPVIETAPEPARLPERPAPEPASLPALLQFPSTAFSGTPAQRPYADYIPHGTKDLYVPLPTENDELPAVEQRCRLKAKAARWAAERATLIREGRNTDTLDDSYRDLIAEARELPDCFLWMCLPDTPGPGSTAQYDTLAHCYDSAAAAVAMLRRFVEQPEALPGEFPRAVELTAEAQSALRGAVLALDVHKPDRDQLRLFSWLRAVCDEQRILVHRYMRKDDIADARNWADVQARVRQMEERIAHVQGRGKRRKKGVAKIAFVTRRLQEHRSTDREGDWQTIFRTVDELVNDGLPPSDVDLRDLLLPVLDDLPSVEDAPKNFRLFLRETDRYLASRPTKPEPDHQEEAPSEQVRQARELLEGKAVLLIGGERRPYAAEALEKAFGLSELVWVETREHQTHAVFESLVARADVAVVVLAIRWSSHGFGEVKAFCDNYGKPLVRLPAGYNPNSVALHIVDQVGQRLRGTG